MAQSPSIAAVVSPSPRASSSHAMSPVAVLEISPSVFPHLPSGTRPLKLPAGGDLEDERTPLGADPLEQECK